MRTYSKAILSLALCSPPAFTNAFFHPLGYESGIQTSLKAIPDHLNRRDALFTSLSIVLSTVTVCPVNAASLSQTQVASISIWPGIENLEPMYELKLSIDALQTAVSDPKNWPYVKKRLDKFFKGALLSEKNFYFGVGLQYMNDIQYSKSELPNYVLLDKQGRYDALEKTMKSLENLQKTLTKEDSKAIQDYAKDSQLALQSWFALVPEEDFRAVQDLFLNVKKADINRDGVLSADELSSLSTEQQDIWKKRVDKFG